MRFVQNIDGHLIVSHLIKSLPASQSESIQIQKCYPGFLALNKYWVQSFSNAKKQNPGLNALTNVHIYYEDWAKTLMESKNHWSSRDYGNLS